MILGILRVIYFFGPALALALVLLKPGSTWRWPLWGLAAALVFAHWVSFLTATEDGSTAIGVLTAAVWTPLLITTLIADRTRSTWTSRFGSDEVSRLVVAALCALPSVIAFFIV